MSKVSRFMKAFAAALAILALGGAAAVAADAKPAKVAVRGFAAKGVDTSIAGTLETSFCSALADQSMEVMCPDEIRALAGHEQLQLGMGTCAENDDDCIKATAKASEASRVITGEVSKLGETYIISVALIDAASGKVMARASDKTTKLEDLLDKLPALAKKLAAAK